MRKSVVGRARCDMSDDSSSGDPPNMAMLEELMSFISSGKAENERMGAKELRKLAKMSSVNRVCIAEVGAIPGLIGLLLSQDMDTQTHAVTALLNLTLRNDSNKQAILMARGLDSVVEILKKGGLEARENAGALLFSLSHSDAYRAIIGLSDAFSGLISLLEDGSSRGKKDAAAALFNLAQIRQNRALAVRAGAVLPLLQLVQDPSSALVDECLSVILTLAGHQEGRFAITKASGIRILLDLMKRGSDSNKEYGCAVLLVLCQHDFTCSNLVRHLGGCELLLSLSQSGTERARRMAAKVLELL